METISQFAHTHSRVLIIIAILSGMIILTWVLLLAQSNRVKKFRSQIKEGMPVCFFIEEDRVIGVVAVVSAEGVVINSVYGQYVRNISEIYPV